MTYKKQNALFIVCAYAFFWLVIVIAGVFVMTGVIPTDGVLMEIGVIIGSWTPTVALFFLFKKIYPDSTIKEFYKNAFKERLNWKLLLCLTVVLLLSLVCSVGIVAFSKGVSLLSLFDLTLQTMGLGFVFTLLGVTGEESGWRGFLQPSLEKKYGVIKSSVIIGVIWGFWHAPVWFMQELGGWDLIQYILLFLIYIISGSIIIGICYNHCKNLIVPIWMHFLCSYSLVPILVDSLDISWLAMFYALAAIGYVVWHKSRKNVLCDRHTNDA